MTQKEIKTFKQVAKKISKYDNSYKNSCFWEAMKYKTRTEFEKCNESAYNAARKNNWLKDYIWLEI